jgi:hypothetical protein
MIAIRELVKIKNHRIDLLLPKDFIYDEVEVIVLPKAEFDYWNSEEVAQIGKIGLASKSFEEDDEDYSKW